MQSRGNLKRALVAVVAGVLIGGGLTTVTPAGAEVSQFAATNWKKIWKKKLQPLADKRYYTKAQSNVRYTAAGSAYSKAEVDAKLGGYYTKAEGDAKYAAAGSSYTKAESDAKYAPYPAVIRGTFSVVGPASAAGQELSNSVSFGVQFPSAPTPHFINTGAVPPAGCSGTPAAPNASPGHLCLFEQTGVNVASRQVFGHAGIPGTVSAFGFNTYIISAAAGTVYSYGSWAARPSGTVTSSLVSPGAPTIGR
jgi:hypothetical protein